MIHNTQSAQISQKQRKCPLSYHHNGKYISMDTSIHLHIYIYIYIIYYIYIYIYYIYKYINDKQRVRNCSTFNATLSFMRSSNHETFSFLKNKNTN